MGSEDGRFGTADLYRVKCSEALTVHLDSLFVGDVGCPLSRDDLPRLGVLGVVYRESIHVDRQVDLALLIPDELDRNYVRKVLQPCSSFSSRFSCSEVCSAAGMGLLLSLLLLTCGSRIFLYSSLEFPGITFSWYSSL